jgi:hypothetical protein
MDIQRKHEKVTTTRIELWSSIETLLSQFWMDPLEGFRKGVINQKMVEDVETKRNLSIKSIERIDEITAEVIETILVQPTRLIALTRRFCAMC